MDFAELKLGPMNEWRQETPGTEGWARTARASDPNKYFVVSCDNHVNEPFNFFEGRIDDRYKDRLPRLTKDEEGNEWLHVEGRSPSLVKPAKSKTDHLQPREKYESWEVLVPYTSRMEQLEEMKTASGRTVEQRLEHAKMDGVDAEIVFPQKGGMGFSTRDSEFSLAMTRAWNRWVLDYFGAQFGKINPVALITSALVDEAVKEVQWAAKNGFKAVQLPNKPIYGPTIKGELAYNSPAFEPLWAAIADANLTATFHVSSGEDPRTADGYGGAIINYVTHSMLTPWDPLVKVVTSGVIARHPKLRFVTVESGVGIIVWMLEQMDHAYKAHHMWVRPVIPELPSTYYRSNCAATLMDEPAGLKNAIDFGLEDNILWSTDYPHHEGSFPFSAQAIERTMGFMTDKQRAKVLGLNGARMFNLDVSSLQQK
ncbi:MAG: amidohydrolase family protein [Phenylobacterium sp.]|uniref:amidohydrolase family protein n=1 Tax=Phenylobacterium sp. TaxID=1871053 RepID=UPI00273472F1|nr:amidohydrolase family protein [Phenylobacterium sp.]MDP3750029.1 amidohydrolase family protein [Phenylobacterium sp.]